MDSAQVEAQLKLIKAQMPETYKAISEKAALIGNEAFRFVRRGVGGLPNNFYAMERGHVVGTPFDLPGVAEGLARVIVEFGVTFMLMWAPEAQQLPAEEKEAAHGQG